MNTKYILGLVTDRIRLYSGVRANKILTTIGLILNLSFSLPSLLSKNFSNIYDFICKRLCQKYISNVKFNDLCVYMKCVDCESIAMCSENYEREITRMIIENLNNGDTFIDVGAHIGRYTLLAAKKVGEKGKVIALEPVPETFNILKYNIRLNDLHNVIALPVAAWNCLAWIRINIYPSRSGSSLVRDIHLTHFRVLTQREFVTLGVPLDTLLKYLVERGFMRRFDIRLLKIDVEGAEKEVLEGSRKLLVKCKPKLLVEISREREGIIKTLSKLGYQVDYVIGNYFVFK